MLLGLSRTAMTIARSLGRRGIKVYGMPVDGENNVAGLSRYCHQVEFIEPTNTVRDIVDGMLDFGKHQDKKLALFMDSDTSLSIVSAHARELSSYYDFLIPPPAVVECVLNKEKFHKTMLDNDLTVPRTYAVNSLEDFVPLALEIPLPCIVKPVYSHAYKARHFAGAKQWPKVVRGVETTDHLLRTVEYMKQFTHHVLIQEYIDGYDYEYNSYVSRHGQLLAESLHKYIWEFSPHDGFKLDKRLVEDMDLIELGRQLVRKLDYRGFCAIEIKRASDGQPHIIELNGRFTSEVGLSIFCGIDYPFVAFADLQGSICSEAQDGARRRAVFVHVPDIINGLGFARSRYKFTVRIWFCTARNFLRLFLWNKVYFAVFALDDLRPWINGTRLLVGRILQGLVKAMRCRMYSYVERR